MFEITAWQNKAKPVHQELKAVVEKAQYSVLISPKQFAAKKAVKNCFLFVCGPRFRDLRFQDFKDSLVATKMKNVCHGHDCR